MIILSGKDRSRKDPAPGETNMCLAAFFISSLGKGSLPPT